MIRSLPLFFLLLAVSCGGPHRKVMGLWKEAATPQKTWEFKSDGTITNSFYTTVVHYKFKWTGDDTMEVTAANGENPRKAKITFAGETMTFQLFNPDQAFELKPF